MANQNKAIGSFDIIRKLVRNLYLEGFNNYLETGSIEKSSRAFSNNLSSIKNFLDSKFLSVTTHTGKNENPTISFNTREESENPLYALWKTANSVASGLSFDFAVMDMLEEYPDGLSWFSLTTDSQSNKHDDLLSYYLSTGIDKKSTKKKLKDLEDAGLIEFFESDKKIRKIDTFKIKDLLESTEVKQAIQFVSEIFPLGVIGSFILDSLKTLEPKSVSYPIHYKHHYIFNSIDSEIMYVLLDAINKKSSVDIETNHNGLTNIIPMQIRISTQTGRTHIIFWKPQEKRFYSENLELILTATIKNECTDYDELKSKFKKLEPNIWGVSFPQDKDKKLEHIDFKIKFEDDEKYILERLKKEAIIGTVTELDETHALFSAEVVDSQEIVPWLRTFIGRITEMNFPYADRIKNDVEFLCEGKYRESQKSLSKPTEKYEPIYKTKTPLFSTLYSYYYQVAKKVIEHCLAYKSVNRDVLDRIINETAFMNDNLELYNIIEYENKDKKTIFSSDKNGVSTKIKHSPVFPLTILELRFLVTVINDEKFTLFLDDDLILNLKKRLSKFTPLWDSDSIKFFDQNNDGDNFSDDNYKATFKTLLKALNEKKSVNIIFGKSKSENITPTHFDYSPKDNRFRIFFKETALPINLRNIHSCKIIDCCQNEEAVAPEYKILKLEIFDDTENKYHFNRAIRQFSYFKKTCKKCMDKNEESNNKYEMTVEYDVNDETEIVIRVLQFGANMKVLEPVEVGEKVQAKVERQREMDLKINLKIYRDPYAD